jgi:hypothetical protein
MYVLQFEKCCARSDRPPRHDCNPRIRGHHLWVGFMSVSGKKRVLLDGYGDHAFFGDVAAPYLKGHGLGENVLESSTWATDGSADKVA